MSLTIHCGNLNVSNSIKKHQSKFIVLFLFLNVFGHEGLSSGNFLCKHCGETIATSKQLHYVNSSLALKHWNQTLLGVKSVTVQLFQNPHNQKFKVVTFSEANAYPLEEVSREASWFEGFAWRICICPMCGHHLGWKYQPTNFNHLTYTEDDTFFGLILDNLLEEAETETILFVPNSYKS